MDFNQPTLTTNYASVLDYIKQAFADLSTFLDGTNDTNIKDNAKRYNSTNNKFEKYNLTTGTWTTLPFHTAIDAALAAVTSGGGLPAGSIIAYSGLGTPSGFLECLGQLVSKSLYPNLAANIGNLYGGDNISTIGIPNLKKRFIAGFIDQSTTPIGFAGGSWDHVHTVGPHAHGQREHNHEFTHSHNLPDHQHLGPAHSHTVPGHYHDTQGSGATIQINDSGNHTHEIPARKYAGAGEEGHLTRSNLAGSIANSATNFQTTLTGSHVHPHSAIVGSIGNRNSNINGDGGFTVSAAGDAPTSGVIGGAGSISSGTVYTGNSGSMNTYDSSSFNSGANNPPYIFLRYLIKT